MTLIVSEVSRHGIAMATDSADTWEPVGDWGLPSGKEAEPVLRTGAKKLVRIDEIDAAIAGWGIACLGTRACPEKLVVPLDAFLLDFASEVKSNESLEEVGSRLSQCVNNRIVPGMPGTQGGFHLAGYTEEEGQRFPALYHIHADDPGGEMKLHLDWPNKHSRCYRCAGIRGWLDELENGGFAFLTNGDFLLYKRLADKLNHLLEEHRQQKDFICPHYEEGQPEFRSELEVHGRYLKLLVEIICQLYLLSDKPASIGRPVSWLTISKQRIEEYHPAGV